jgi:hypothetical protein
MQLTHPPDRLSQLLTGCDGLIWDPQKQKAQKISLDAFLADSSRSRFRFGCRYGQSRKLWAHGRRRKRRGGGGMEIVGRASEGEEHTLATKSSIQLATNCTPAGSASDMASSR